MVSCCHTLVRLRQRRRLIGMSILLIYVALLIQPCAMAMDHELLQHPASCHEELVTDTGLDCLSQPVAECTAGGLTIDSRDNSTSSHDLPPLSRSLTGFADIVAVDSLPREFLRRAPPFREPAINLRHCVFLI